jgi:chromosome segregation ATPase
MKKYIIGAIVGILVMTIGGHFYTKARVSKWKQDAIEWKQSYEAEKAIVAQNELASNQKIDLLLEKIGDLQGNIDSLMTVNADLENHIIYLEQTNEETGAAIDQLMTEVQPVLDSNPKVRELVDRLKSQNANKDQIIFTLKEQRANDQKIIFNLTDKYEAQVQISSELKLSLEAKAALLAKAELRVNLLDKRVAALGRSGDLKSVLTVGVALVTLASILF